MLDMIDDEDRNRFFGGFQLESKLFLNGREEGRRVAVGSLSVISEDKRRAQKHKLNGRITGGTMELHFICYEVKDGTPGRIVLDKVCARATPLSRKAPDALMADIARRRVGR